MMNKTDCPEPPKNFTAVDSTARQCIDALMKSQAESDERFGDLCEKVLRLCEAVADQKKQIETLRTESRSFESRVHDRVAATSLDLLNLRNELGDLVPKGLSLAEQVIYDAGYARGKEVALERPGREAK